MYRFTLAFLNTLRVVGLKKTAVRVALFLDKHSKSDSLSAAAWSYLRTGLSGYELCTECYLPVLSDTDNLHKQCREDIEFMKEQEKETEEAWQNHLDSLEHDRNALELLMESFCTEHDCYQEGVAPYGMCDKHTAEEDQNPENQYDPEAEECQGQCGQSVRTCTCAELESLRRHNADPATRGSWWTP